MLRVTRDGLPVRVEDCRLPEQAWFEDLVGEEESLGESA